MMFDAGCLMLDIFEPDTVFRPRHRLPTLQGGHGHLYWLLNGKLVWKADIGEALIYQFKCPGRYQLTVMDLAGNYDALEIIVLEGIL